MPYLDFETNIDSQLNDLIDDSDKFILRKYFTDKRFKCFVDEREHWSENLITYWQAYQIWDKKQSKIKHKPDAKFCFITIQDFQRRMTDIDKLLIFINKISYLYSEGHWVIEAGKSDPPNLHIHIFAKIINSKKHKSKLNIEWMKLFDSNLTHKDYYKLQQHNNSPLMPSYEQWCQEKVDYLCNDKKGSHTNTLDLNLRGTWGEG